MTTPHERLRFGSTKNPNTCTVCRKLKQKCGGQRPSCDRCEKRGRVCMYLDSNMVSGNGATAAHLEKDKAGSGIEGAGGEAMEEAVKKAGTVGLDFGGIGDGEMNANMDVNMDLENSNIPVAGMQPGEEWLMSHVFPARRAPKAHITKAKHAKKTLVESEVTLPLTQSQKNASSVITDADAHTHTHIPNASKPRLELFSVKKPSAMTRSMCTKAISVCHEATKKAKVQAPALNKNNNNNMEEDNRNLVCDTEEDKYGFTSEAAAEFKRGGLQAEAMFALRSSEDLSEARPIIFDDIDLSALDLNAKQAWNIMSQKVVASIDMAEEGVEWDLKGTKRSELRDLILNLNEQQKTWRETPELMLALGRLAQMVLQFHDFYEQLGACMTSLTGLGLVLNRPVMPFNGK